MVQGFWNKPEETEVKKSLNIEAEFFPSKAPEFYMYPESELSEDMKMAKKLGLRSYTSEANLDTLSFLQNQMGRLALYLDYHYVHPEENTERALQNLKHGLTPKNRWLYSRMTAIKNIIDHPTAFMKFFSSNLPFFLFFFTPLYAFFFWLIYSRKTHSYMQHVIFTFHVFSAIFLFSLFLSILERTFGLDLIWINFFFLAPIYFFLALKRFYGQRFFKTLGTFIFLATVFVFGFAISLTLYLAGTAVVY